MKELGYRIFGWIYAVFCLLPLKKNSAFLIMTHDAGPEGNVAVMGSYLEKNYNTFSWKMVRSDTDFSGEGKLKKAFRFFFGKSYEMARAEYVFMDNAFLPLAFMKVRKGTTVVQLWHGTGTIKKFGQDVNTGRLYELEKKGNENIDYLIVNSDATREMYAGCFSVPIEKVKVFGLPRTDLLFCEQEKMVRTERFYRHFPKLKGKKLILYAPTFRDHEVDDPKLRLDVKKMVEELPEEYCLGLRLHPFVSDCFVMEEGDGDRVMNFSDYESLNTLLMVTDILVSDYSSIIFEYCVYRKPMIFFAYDLQEFSDNGRGFYRDYEEYVPGPVVQNTEELLRVIQKKDWKSGKLAAFVKESYQYMDGKSAKRLAEFIKTKE